jgi:mRNA capping enzyme, catalytic domain
VFGRLKHVLAHPGKLPRGARVSASQTQFHHGTLLDGEMCGNVHPDGRRERVFYVYDLMMLHGANVTARPWKVRLPPDDSSRDIQMLAEPTSTARNVPNCIAAGCVTRHEQSHPN